MKKDILIGWVWGGGILLLSLAAVYALKQGYIDKDTMMRIVIGVNGLMIAFYGNRAPKAVAPSTHARQVARFSGWIFVLTGLVYTGFWAFAPIPLATIAGTAVVAASLILTFGYCFWLKGRKATGA